MKATLRPDFRTDQSISQPLRPQAGAGPTCLRRPLAFLFGLGLAGLLAGCATSSSSGLMTYHDDISGDIVNLMTDNKLAGNPNPNTEIWLNASRIAKPNGVIYYYLDVHVESLGNWLQIDPGDTLVLTIDGQDSVFGGIGSGHSRTTTKDGRKAEDAHYKATSGDFRNLAEAKVVRVRVIGARSTLQQDFGPANSQTFKDFVAKYLDRG